MARMVTLAVMWGLGSMLVARWHRTWGAKPEEAAAALAGDELVPDPVLQTTRAVTIAAPPQAVWPWLVQMGQGRGGLYTYELVENALGAQIHNADEVVPELQHLEVGDLVRLTPDPYLGHVPGQAYRVEAIQPNEALVLVQELPSGGVTTWTFTLRSTGEASTRLIVRARRSRPDRFGQRVALRAELLLLEPGYFVMERGMLRGIRTRAERTSQPFGCIVV